MGNNVYLLGWADLEMKTIWKVLKRNNKEVIDKKLWWWANIESYKDDVEEILQNGNNPVSVELWWASEVTWVIDIDHHWDRVHEKAAILQVLEIEWLSPNLYQELVAANDSGFIQAMEKLLDEKKEEIETSLKSWQSFEDFKSKFIQIIRKKDRTAQWIDGAKEKQAEEAIKSREDYFDGNFTIVRLPHSKSATVTDRLYGTYKNLLVISEDWESNFFWDGKICKEFADKYQGSWSGWSELWIEGWNAFWGWYVDQKELEGSLKTKLADSIFLPENTQNLTDLWKQIYELWSFESLFETTEISKVYIENKWKDISFVVKAKNWYSIYEIKAKDLFWWYSRYKDRRDKAQKIFWFDDEDQKLPLYIFIKDSYKIDQQISRWLTKIDEIKFEAKPDFYISWKYYKAIKDSNFWKEAIEKEVNSDNKELNFENVNFNNPIISTLNDKFILEKINILLEWKEVALYTTWSFHWYFETLKSTWIFNKIDIPSYDKYFSEFDIKEAIENTNKWVSFPADSDFKYAYIEALKKAWYEVEKIWNSGFDARNKYSVIIPNITKELHIIKIWSEINWESFKEKKIAYFWIWNVDTIDLEEKKKIEEIMQNVEKTEKSNQEQKFLNYFISKSLDNWISSIMKVGWNEEFQYPIPDRFVKLAEIKVWNTQDHRQNKTHTYEVILLDKESVKWKTSVDIKIPDNYKWLVIWKWWANIKEISQRLWIIVNVK